MCRHVLQSRLYNQQLPNWLNPLLMAEICITQVLGYFIRHFEDFSNLFCLEYINPEESYASLICQAFEERRDRLQQLGLWYWDHGKIHKAKLLELSPSLNWAVKVCPPCPVSPIHSTPTIKFAKFIQSLTRCAKIDVARSNIVACITVTPSVGSNEQTDQQTNGRAGGVIQIGITTTISFNLLRPRVKRNSNIKFQSSFNSLAVYDVTWQPGQHWCSWGTAKDGIGHCCVRRANI